MDERSLIIKIRNRAIDAIEEIKRTVHHRVVMAENIGRERAFQEILDIIDVFYEEKQVFEAEQRNDKLDVYKRQLKSLYTELEEAMDYGKLKWASSIHEEIQRVRRLISEIKNQQSPEDKPIGRKLRIEL